MVQEFFNEKEDKGEYDGVIDFSAGMGPKIQFFSATEVDGYGLCGDFFDLYKKTEKIYLTEIYFKSLQRSGYLTEIKSYYALPEDYKDKIIQIANTTFMFNYENSPNEDIFFINDFERGGVIQDVPYKPTREGYDFAGWYKEPECINKWNFETDTLPPAQYDENNELIFVETKLYAKWI